MKKIVRLSESELVSIINNILLRETKQSRPLKQLKEWDDFGTPGKLCIQWIRKKDGTMITGPMTNCEYLDQNGVMKPEIAKKQYSGAFQDFVIIMLFSNWQYNYLNPGKIKNNGQDLSGLLNYISDKSDFDNFVNKFNEKVKTYKFKPGVPQPTLGEALALWLGVDNNKGYFEQFKKHMEKIGVPVSIGKGVKNLTELKFSESQSVCSSGYKNCSGKYTICCNSPKIAEVQRCLGIKNPDGKWGQITQNKLKSSFPNFANSFTDSDISTICSNKNKSTSSSTSSSTPTKAPRPKGEY